MKSEAIQQWSGREIRVDKEVGQVRWSSVLQDHILSFRRGQSAHLYLDIPKTPSTLENERFINGRTQSKDDPSDVHDRVDAAERISRMPSL